MKGFLNSLRAPGVGTSPETHDVPRLHVEDVLSVAVKHFETFKLTFDGHGDLSIMLFQTQSGQGELIIPR